MDSGAPARARADGRKAHLVVDPAQQAQFQQLVQEAERSLRFPHTALRLWRLAHDPKASAQEVARIIDRDPAIAARVLKVANSAMFPYPGQIADIHRAIAVIGMREIAEIALTSSCVAGFSPLENALLRRADFWWHSFSVALLAQDLARSHGQEPEEAFTAGLLHDIGQMLLFAKRPQVMIQVLHESLGDEQAMPALEQERLGFDHAELGAALLRAWKLPDRLCRTVALHHRDAAQVQKEPLADLVRLANGGAGLSEVSKDAGDTTIIQLSLCARLGVDADSLSEHLDENRQRVDALCAGLGLERKEEDRK